MRLSVLPWAKLKVLIRGPHMPMQWPRLVVSPIPNAAQMVRTTESISGMVPQQLSTRLSTRLSKNGREY